MLSKITTGCENIDRFLNGGLSPGTVTLIYGEPETGKTTLATQCAVNCALQGYKTLLIDCDGTFSAKRLSQIASDDFKKISDLIILMRPISFRDQTFITDRLADYLTKGFGLVVVDTVTSLYRVEVAQSSEKTFQLNRELNRQLASLAQASKIQRVAVIIVSQVRTVFKEESVAIEPVATRVLKFWADTIIDLRPTETPQAIKAVLEKPMAGPQPVTYSLKIAQSGIHEYTEG